MAFKYFIFVLLVVIAAAFDVEESKDDVAPISLVLTKDQDLAKEERILESDEAVDNLVDEVLEEEAAIENLEESPRKANAQFTQDDLLKLLNSNAALNEKIPINRQAEDTTDQHELTDSPITDGLRCIPKVVQVEETVYDRGMKCNHSFQEKCHMTFITDYKSSTQKKCNTSFKKNCHITFKPTTIDEKVKICHIPLVRQCGGTTTGPPICSTEYEDVCETIFKNYEIEQDQPECKMENIVRCQNTTQEISFGPHVAAGEVNPIVKENCEQWPVQKCTLEKKRVNKVHPETGCKKVPKQICIPNNCSMVKGPEVCKDEKRSQIQNIPEEECDLQPEEQCHLESVLVPRLVPKPNCIKVPKEICVNTRKNPRRVSKPVVKEWCYNSNDLNTKK